MCSTLRLRPHTGLVAQPTFGWRESAGPTLVLADPDAACLIDVTGAVGCTLSGLCLDGRDLGGGVHGVSLDKPDYGKVEDNLRIERCKISRFTGHGLHLGRVWCFSIRHCMISHNAGDGVQLRGWDGFVLDNWLSVNGGAGLLAHHEHNAITLTGNRIEWNRHAGVKLFGGSHVNLTGNYIDRAGGPALWLDQSTHTPRAPDHLIVGSAGHTTITGNTFYRSARPIWQRHDLNPDCHVLLRGQRGVTFTGNCLVAGHDDRDPNSSTYSPPDVPSDSPGTGLILEALLNTVISQNTLDRAALHNLIDDRGGHRGGVVIRDNPGCLFEPENTST